MNSTPLRVGIAGYGVVGQRRRSFIDKMPNFETVAICDRKFDLSEHVEEGIASHPDYQSLLDENLDVLFVCMTNDMAPEVSIAGLDRGFHVFCEKPPGRNLQDTQRVYKCEQKHPGLKLKYGFNHRYHDSVLDALKIIQSGELGKIINLRGVYGKSKVINFESDWRTKRSIAGGGILLDQGIHMVDLIRLFAGEFVDIHSFISNDYWKHDVEDNAYALMRTESGVVAMLHSSATQWRHRFNLDITLEEGTIVLSGILSGTKSYGAETLTVARKLEHDAGDPRETTTRYTSDPSWESEVKEFSHAIANDKMITNGSSKDALRTMQMVYRIYCSDPDWKEKFDLDDSLSIELDDF
jgi:predicted dehydrogenase